MDSRGRANSTAMKGLLERQIANIAETLARASRRRDAEMQVFAALHAKGTFAVQAPLPVAPVKGSLSSEMEGMGGDLGVRGGVGGLGEGANVKEDMGRELGHSVAVDEPGKGPDMKDSGFEESDMDLSQDNFPQASLRGGYASDDEDQKTLLTRAERSDSPTITHDDSRHLLADLSHFPSTAECGGEDISDLLADLDCASLVGRGVAGDDTDSVDLQSVLAEFGSITSAAHTLTFPDNDDSLRRMLSEPEEPASVGESETKYTTGQIDFDMKNMLADLDRQTTRGSGDKNADEENLEGLHSGLMGLLSPGTSVQLIATSHSPIHQLATLESPDQPSPAAEHTVTEMTEPDVDPSIISYVIAIELENEGCEWQIVQGWTTYLFGSGLDSHKACQEKHRIVQQAAEELDKIIRIALVEEEQYQGETSITRLPRRLLVSNIAADARIEDLEKFFYRHRFAVQNYKIKPDRDPVRRTQTAHVDMQSRQAAIQASFMTGSIFGLMLDIKLAVEEED